MELVLDYVLRGIHAALFTPDGAVAWMTLVMVVSGLIGGIVVGAVPGLNGPFAMAIALPVLISSFGTGNEALLPVLAFLIGVMKGSTLGGAVPAVLFNTPGTPDALMTTRDGYPMAQQGRAGEALQTAHYASVRGDTFSDMVLFVAAPTLAVLVERVLDLPEKAAIIILSLSFMAAVSGSAVLKGLMAGVLGMLLALIGSSVSGYGPRMTLGLAELKPGIPATAAIMGMLILSEAFAQLESLWRRRAEGPAGERTVTGEHTRMTRSGKRLLRWVILRSAAIGTAIGSLPGIGTTLAATLAYEASRARAENKENFGKGDPRGLASCEAANSAVSGANLIPVMSLGIPGNLAAVFIILAVDSVGDFTFGPQVFRFTEIKEVAGYGTILNASLVIAFSIFTLMSIANLVNWVVGGRIMVFLGVLSRIPAAMVAPAVVLLTLTAAYVQDGGVIAIATAFVFGVIGYVMMRLHVPLLPFIIGFILSPNLEQLLRGGFSASGADPLFLFKSPLSCAFLLIAVAIVVTSFLKSSGARTE